MNLKDVLKRMNEIAKELENENADVDALTVEFNELRSKKEALEASAEQRSNLLGSITRGLSGTVLEEREDRSNMSSTDAISRSAFLKSVMNRPLTEEETRAMTSITSTGLIPTTIKSKILTALEEKYPIIEKMGITEIPDNIQVPVHSTDNGANIVAENGQITDAVDKITYISLGGFVIAKYTTCSDKLMNSSIDVFEAYMINNLVNNNGKLIANLIVNATGENMPVGLCKAGSGESGAYVAGKDLVTVTKDVVVKNTDVLSWLGMVNSVNAVAVMSYKTFLTYFYPLMDNSKNCIVKEVNGTYYLVGREVVFEESVVYGESYLYDPEFLPGNFQKPIMFEKARKLNPLGWEMVGHCIFDCKPATGMFKFAKFVKEQPVPSQG